MSLKFPAWRFLAALIICVANTVGALAHTQLLESTPHDEQVVDSTLAELRLKFNEALESSFRRIEIIGADGKAAPAGKLRMVEGDDHTAVVTLDTLLAGR